MGQDQQEANSGHVASARQRVLDELELAGLRWHQPLERLLDELTDICWRTGYKAGEAHERAMSRRVMR